MDDGIEIGDNHRMEKTQRPGLSIRPFRPEDQTEAKTLILEGLKEHWGSIDPQMNPDLDDIAASYAGGFFLVAVLGDRIVATGGLIPRAAGVAEIMRMSVANGQRRRGIGSAVLRRLLEDAKAAGYQKIILETTATWDEAIAFYQKHDFRLTYLRGGDTFFALDLSPIDASA
jgi:putative acetyltransferase